MSDQFKFRFTGKMPRGKTEYLCPCGEHNTLQIGANDKEVNANCGKCGKKVTFVDQGQHWHIFIE